MQSSCEYPSSGQPSSSMQQLTENGSRLHRFQAAETTLQPHLWSGIAVQDYKPSADHHCGVLRSTIVGEQGEHTRFHLRYFEIQPGGFSTREHHQHEHVVVVLRGEGEVWLADRWHPVGYGDTVYVAPHEVHQLRNQGREPFGFLCIVDAERDRPILADDASVER